MDKDIDFCLKIKLNNEDLIGTIKYSKLKMERKI